MSKKAPTTLHPITVAGWYERTDGTWGFYVWSKAEPFTNPRCVRVCHRKPDPDEWDWDMLSKRVVLKLKR